MRQPPAAVETHGHAEGQIGGPPDYELSNTHQELCVDRFEQHEIERAVADVFHHLADVWHDEHAYASGDHSIDADEDDKLPRRPAVDACCVVKDCPGADQLRSDVHKRHDRADDQVEPVRGQVLHADADVERQ